MNFVQRLVVGGWVVVSLSAGAQTATNMAALGGLAPVSTLTTTDAGKAALGANYVVTGGLQRGEIRQATLMPFADEQQLALRDVFSTIGNLAQLSDGLGTTLEAAYVARAHYLDRESFTSVSPEIATLIGYATSVTGNDSNSAKFFFANGTTDGTKPVSADALGIYKRDGGSADPFGRTYGFPAGAAGAGKYGDARPFQTEVSVASIVGPDYFHTPADNTVYSRGPMMDLRNSPSYPSGHTTYGYTGALLLALLVPERYAQMVTRGAEYGNDRILVGAHYAMDVLGGRTLAMYDMAHLLANDPAYVGQTTRKGAAIKDFRAAVVSARAQMVKVLEANCGNTLATCAAQDTGRFSGMSADAAFYESTQTYDLPVVFAKNAGVLEDVGKVAPEAGYLLTVAFPALTMEQADKILTETEGPGGGFLDDGSGFGVYSRIDLFAASQMAARMAVSH